MNTRTGCVTLFWNACIGSCILMLLKHRSRSLQCISQICTHIQRHFLAHLCHSLSWHCNLSGKLCQYACTVSLLASLYCLAHSIVTANLRSKWLLHLPGLHQYSPHNMQALFDCMAQWGWNMIKCLRQSCTFASRSASSWWFSLGSPSGFPSNWLAAALSSSLCLFVHLHRFALGHVDDRDIQYRGCPRLFARSNQTWGHLCNPPVLLCIQPSGDTCEDAVTQKWAHIKVIQTIFSHEWNLPFCMGQGGPSITWCRGLCTSAEQLQDVPVTHAKASRYSRNR